MLRRAFIRQSACRTDGKAAALLRASFLSDSSHPDEHAKPRDLHHSRPTWEKGAQSKYIFLSGKRHLTKGVLPACSRDRRLISGSSMLCLDPAIEKACCCLETGISVPWTCCVWPCITALLVWLGIQGKEVVGRDLCQTFCPAKLVHQDHLAQRQHFSIAETRQVGWHRLLAEATCHNLLSNLLHCQTDSGALP